MQIDTPIFLPIVSKHKQHKTKKIEDLISDNGLFFKKFGRIIYFGTQKYSNKKIELETGVNWFTLESANWFEDSLNNAKKDEIKRILYVINDDEFDTTEIFKQRLLHHPIQINIILTTPVEEWSETLRVNVKNIFYKDGFNKEVEKIFQIELPEHRRKPWLFIKKKNIQAIENVEQ